MPAIAGGQRSAAPKISKILDPLAGNYPSTTESTLRALKQGVEDYLSGRFEAALTALPDATAARATAINDYILLYRAKANLMLDRGDEALRHFRLLQSRYPDSSQLTEAILGECQALLKLRDPAAALSVLENPGLEENAEVFYFRGRTYEDAGRPGAARALYLQVFTDYVNSKTAALAEQRLRALSPRFEASSDNYRSLLIRAENLLRAGRIREARTLLSRLASVRAPDMPSAQKRMLLFAEAEFELGRAMTALRHLQKITSANPELHARALYLQGACNRSLRKEESILAARDLALRLYPQSPFTERLLNLAAAYFEGGSRFGQAQENYRVLLGKFPNGEYTERALWRVAVLLYADREYDRALQEFSKYLRACSSPGSASAPVYWMGRCYENLGDTQAAMRFYERARALANDSYYGKRAEEAQLGLKNRGATPGFQGKSMDPQEILRSLDRFAFPDASIQAPAEPIAVIIERARQLIAADLSDLAVAELLRALQKFPGDKPLSYALSRIYENRGDTYHTIVTLRRAFPDYSERSPESLPAAVWEMFFPIRYWKPVFTHASKNNLEPNLVLAIIRQESSFDEQARSPANARGLMQVLPSTGRKRARQAGVARYALKKLYTAEANIAIGTRHLAGLFEQFHGKVELALAAYNAGEHRVDQWINDLNTLDMAEFVERIPFSETRNYIKQVFTGRARYRWRTASSGNGSL